MAAKRHRAQQGQRAPLFAGLAVVLLLAVLQWSGTGLLDRFGLQLFDAYQRAAPRPVADTPVRIIDIDEESIARLGQWPWPRSDLAKLVERLNNAGAAVIAFDIVFAEPDRTSPAVMAQRLTDNERTRALTPLLLQLPDHDRQFAAAIAQAQVVGGFFLLRENRGAAAEVKAGFAVAGSPPTMLPRFSGAVQSIPVIAAAERGSGFLSLVGDRDAIVRKAPMLALHDNQLVPSLSLEALRVAQGAGTLLIKTSDASGETAGAAGRMVSVRVGDFTVPLTEAGELWSWFGAQRPDRTIAAWKIMSGALQGQALEEAVGGRILFIGTSASGLRDLVATPLRQREPGVLVHAEAAEQMIAGQFLVRPDWARGLELALLLLGGGMLALLLPRIGAATGAALGLALMAAITGGSWLAFHRGQYLLDPSWPLLALLMVYVTQTMLGYYREERRRAYIHNAFDRYLSPELVKRIAADPDALELGGEERDMTVLFCDIRGFSRISERLSPQQTISFLINFLTPMSEILLAHRGTLDKFIGDAILTFWNAPLADPDQHAHAARAALAMQSRLAELNQTMPGQDGQQWPGAVQIGIGLNAGLCCVGNMGSRQRLSYSLIGDIVNTASRFEGLTKYYGVGIIAGERLHDELPAFAMLELDWVRVVGRDAPETIHALIGDESLGSNSDFQGYAAIHAAMLAAYRDQRWDTADDLLGQLAVTAGRWGMADYGVLMAQRIAAFRTHPPAPDWGGVFIATEK